MRERATYVGVFLVAMATLVLEILLVRITSVVAWYHLAFFVISLAMLGLTAGAVLVFVRPRWFDDAAVPARLAQGATLLALTTPIFVALALGLRLRPVTDLTSFAALLGYGALVAVPFTVGGVVLTLALTRTRLPPGRVYGIDLCGAASGSVLVIPLLAWVDAPSGVVVAAALAAAAAHAFVRARATAPASQTIGTAVLTLALLVVAGINASSTGAWLRPRWVKGVEDDPRAYAFVGWNTYSRVSVTETTLAPPALWGIGRNAPPSIARPIPQRFIAIDGAAGTAMAALDTTPDDGRPGTPADHAYLTWDVTSFAHVLRPDGPAAVIGVGGGRDVLEAVRTGHRPVVGLELNALIVALHEPGEEAFSGLAGLPGVELVQGEARSFLARDDRRYRVITMSLIDTWASTGAGAYALSENGLYTVEGFRVFMQRLDERGIFSVSRWYKASSPGETARMLALAMETLWSLGVESPRQHLILLQSGSIATLLVSRAPFSPADLDHMQRQAVSRGFNMVLTPRRLPASPVLAALGQIDDRATLWRWASQQTLDFTPPTDTRPFFFNMLRPAAWLDPPAQVDELDLAFLGNLHATRTLVHATIVSVVLTLLALAVPLGLRHRDLRGYALGELAAACGYFVLIGLGFMFVEIGLLSRLNVFVGHPTLALSTLLGGIILFTGLGSLVSERIPLSRRAVLAYPLIPAVLVMAVTACMDPVMRAFTAAPTPLRIAIGVAMVGVPALGMGLCFPLGLRLVARLRGETRRPDLGPWMWGLNGASGVVASGLALTSSIAWGIGTTLLFGAVCYVLLLACSRRLAAAA